MRFVTLHHMLVVFNVHTTLLYHEVLVVPLLITVVFLHSNAV